MKNMVASLFIMLLCVGALANDQSYPKLFFSYSFLYDGVCAGNNPVNSEMASEAEARAPKFAQIWESNAAQLMSELLAGFGKGFSRTEMTATLSVCTEAPSYSDPLVLNVTRYLKSYAKNRLARPDHAFVDLVFHELLHTWLVENFKGPTPLLEKYKNESGTVKNHLHLMALQKFIYLKTNRQDLLDWMATQNPRMPGEYGRAWDIVNRIEGYEAFIAELKSR